MTTDELKRAFWLGMLWGVVFMALMWLALAFSGDEEPGYDPKAEMGVQV